MPVVRSARWFGAARAQQHLDDEPRFLIEVEAERNLRADLPFFPSGGWTPEKGVGRMAP